VDNETYQKIYIDNNKLLSIYKSRDGASRSHIKLLIGTIIAYRCKQYYYIKYMLNIYNKLKNANFISLLRVIVQCSIDIGQSQICQTC